MNKVEEIKAEIDKLSPRERCELNALMHPMPDDDWDKQMRADAESGKLDWMFKDAERAEREGTSKRISQTNGVNSKTTPEFWQLFNALPKEVQILAAKNYRLWLMDQSYPSLHFKPFKRNLWCVRVGSHYRATGVFLNNETFRWTWIGTHEEYNKLR